MAPYRTAAPVHRDLPFAARRRKRLYVYLRLLRLVRRVRHPLPVRRHLRPTLGEFGLEVRIWLPVSGDRQHPNVVLRLRVDSIVEDESAVASPVARKRLNWCV